MRTIGKRTSFLLLLQTLSLLGGLLLVLLALSMTASAMSPGDAVAIRSIALIQDGPSALDPFRRPCGLATDPQRGIIIVADNGRSRVVFLDSSGRSRGTLSWAADSPGRAPGEPRGVALSKHGHLCVVHGDGSVEVLTTTGSHLGFLQFEEDAGLAQQPRAVSLSVGASGRFYVLRTGSANEIAVLDDKGDPVGNLRCEKLLDTPVAVAVNADESLLAVADPQSNFQIKLLSTRGALVRQFGPHGTGDGTFSLAVDVTWGPSNTLWVTDTLRHSISVFDVEGVFLGRVGGFGYGPGQFNHPAACEFLGEGRIVVLERASGRFQIVDLDISLPGSEAFERLQPANVVGENSDALVSRGKVKEQ